MKHRHVFLLFCGPVDHSVVCETWHDATAAAQEAATDNKLGKLYWVKTDEGLWADFNNIYRIEKVLLWKRGSKR